MSQAHASISDHVSPPAHSPSLSGGGFWSGAKETGAVLALAIVFLLAYLLVFVVNRQVFAREIIFYDALGCLLATTAVLALLWVAGIFRLVASERNVARIPLAILVFALLGYSFAITVPALINRSVSFFMITNVVESEAEGITAQELESRFIDQYVIAYEAIPRRLEEQMETGNFERRGDRYFATSRGEFTYSLQKSLLAAFRTSEDFGAIDSGE